MHTPSRLPIDVTGLDVAFGGGDMLRKILPPMKDIPDEFTHERSPWVRWQQEWFYRGLTRWPVARDGIDVKKAIANLRVVQGSFEPKHEHKQAGVAYLASLWFSSPDGEPIKKDGAA